MLKKCGCAKSCCRTKVFSCKGEYTFFTNLCTCNDCKNRHCKFQSDVRSNELIINQCGEDSSSDDECHDVMGNDEIDISDENKNGNLLELMDLVNDDEDDGDGIEEDVIDF